jgi:peroxiredoxin
MGNQLKAGQAFPALRARTIHDRELAIPDPGRWVHLQFRRFAGCPVCNLHLQAFVHRHGEIAGAGVEEVMVFHSADAELLPYQGKFPFAVIGDPLKELYKRYGVETSLAAILNPAAWGAALKGNLRGPRRRSFDGDLDQGTTNRPTPVATINLGGAPNTIRFRSQSN